MMKDIIDSFYVRSPEGGLYLIAVPTGQGKTYAIAKYIAEHFLDHGKKMIFYLTTQKKNVEDAFNDCSSLVPSSNKEIFEKRAIHLKSNIDYALEWFAKDRKSALPENIRQSQKFIKLENAYSIYQGSKNTDAMDIFMRAEYEFRSYLGEFLKKELGPKKKPLEMLDQLEGKAKYAELFELYPQLRLDEKNIIFCTVDKFMLTNSSILGPNFRFWNERRINRSLIVIDEFDAAKKAMKNRQIDDSISGQLEDMFGQIQTISSRLSFGIDPYRSLFSDGEGRSEEKNNRVLYEKMKKKFLSDKNLKCSNNFRYIGDEENPSIFYRGVHVVFSPLKDEKMHLTIVNNGSDNDIELSSAPADKDKESLDNYVKDGTGLITYFVRGMSLMAKNIIDAQKDAEKEVNPLEYVVNSAIGEMGIANESSRDYFREKIMDDRFYRDSRVPIDHLSPYYYDKGFSLTYLANKEGELWRTSINTLHMSMTPERFLYLLCSRVHVIGLSATCTIDSPISNFDLSYLKEKLKKKYVEPNEEEKKALAKLFPQQENRYGINIHFINSEEPLKDLFLDEDLVNTFKSKISNKIGPSKNRDFQIKRIEKTVAAIGKFLINDEAEALLVMRNENASKEDGKPWNENFIHSILEEMKEDLDNYHGREYEIIALDGKSIAKGKSDISRARSEGKKVVIVSSYATVGIGQNLQYRIARAEDSEILKEEDIDSTYVEKPTHVIANVGEIGKGMGKDNVRNSLLAVTQIEEIASRGSITSGESAHYLKQMFGKVTGTSVFEGGTPRLYSSSEVNDASIAILIQGLGRLTRTRTSTRTKNVYVDGDIKELDFSHLSYLSLNDFSPVFRELYRQCLKPRESEENPFIVEAENNALFKNEQLKQNLNYFLERNKDEYSDDAMEFWKAMRKELIRHPYFLNQEEYMNSAFPPLYCYVQAPKGMKIIGYEEHKEKGGEIKSISLTLEGKGEPLSIPGMNLLTKNPWIAELFIKEGIPTSIQPSFAIMGPHAMQAIYLGAIGEFLLSNIMAKFGIILKEIDDPKKFEKFDFVLADDPSVYFDAKCYRKNSILGCYEKASQKEVLANIRKKLRLIGGKKAVIINTFPVKLKTIPYIRYGNDVLAINCLYDMDSDDLSFNAKVIEEIWRFIHE